MPGIFTHNRILKESILHLSDKRKKNFLLNSLTTLFNTEEHLSAALFGAIGPNIFDYIPKRNKKNYYGNDISYYLHNGNCDKFLFEMINKIYSYKDKNTEWAAMQRAYLYGFISHIVSDSIFHPFIFYYSGFPDTYTKKEIIHFREQNLIFSYNIDNYYLFYSEDSQNIDLNIDEMIPIERNSATKSIKKPVKSFILESIHKSHPDIYKKLVLKNAKSEDSMYSSSFGYLDFIPNLIKMTYFIKKSNNKYLYDFIRNLRRNNIIYSDFLVHYPKKKLTNKNILNQHREKWQNPSGKPGFRYESIDNLMAISCEKIIEIWEKIESNLYSGKEPKIDDLVINAYTGDETKNFDDMKIKSPIRLRL